jgi:hypothetical protein
MKYKRLRTEVGGGMELSGRTLKMIAWGRRRRDQAWVWGKYAGIFLGVLAVWMATPYVITHWLGYRMPKNAGGFGDIFGSVSSLFAGLAFYAVLITFFNQRKEIERNKEELRKQLRLMTTTARLTALPILIKQEKERIWAIDKQWLPHFVEEDYHPERLEEFREQAELRKNHLVTVLALKRREVEAPGAFAGAIYGQSELADRLREIDVMEEERKRKELLIPRLERLKELSMELDEVCRELP